jgi:hypothetical protein
LVKICVHLILTSKGPTFDRLVEAGGLNQSYEGGTD